MDTQANGELLQNIELQTKKLAILLYQSTMPDEVKEAWVELLPQMSLEQIERLLNIVEAKYIDEQSRDIDKEYREKLEAVVMSFDKKRLQDKQELLARISK